MEPHPKDGGVFVKFKYKASGAEEPALNVIEESLRQEARMNGGIATWLGPRTPNVWLVKGSPWTEVSLLIPCIVILLTCNIGYNRTFCIRNTQGIF